MGDVPRILRQNGVKLLARTLAQVQDEFRGRHHGNAIGGDVPFRGVEQLSFFSLRQATGFEKLFATSGLHAEQLDLVKALTYTNGGSVCFCDIEVLRHFFSTEDFRHLIAPRLGLC